MSTAQENDVLGILNKLGINVDGAKVAPEKNAPMQTGGTGYGEEMIPVDALSKEIFDAVPEYSKFLEMLPGYHGTNLDKSGFMPIWGEAPMAKHGAEHTSGALIPSEAATPNNITGEVPYTCSQLYVEIDVSTLFSDFNIAGEDGLQSKLRELIAKSLSRTIEAQILNGDTVTAATGNVNSDDAAPAADAYYIPRDGLIKQALITDVEADNVGAMDFADFIKTASRLGGYFGNPEECLWLFNPATYTKALGIEEFLTASVNGKDSTVFKGALTNILGADLVSARDLGKAEADGKQSATPANNTLGRYLMIWKPIVQYGYRGGINLFLVNMGRKGYQLQGWVNFGFGLVQKKVGITDTAVAIGYNITL